MSSPSRIGALDTVPGAPAAGPPILLFATATGVLVANLFAPQTLVGPIGASLGLPASASGLVAMITLLGYALGLFLLVPLADIAENRRLVLAMVLCAIAAAALATVSRNAYLLMALLFLLGAACSAIQVLVPIAAAMASPERRGRVIGDVMGGLMAGILLARPIASMIADQLGWRAFYGASAMAMGLLGLALARRLPMRHPAGGPGYPALLASLWHLLRAEPVLRLRAFTAAVVMAAFSLFWTSIALRLALPPYRLGQQGVALFALAGAGAAIITPWVGRAGDRGWTRPVTVASHAAMIAAFGLMAWAGRPAAAHAASGLVLLGMGAVMLDGGVTGDQTLGRRAINLLDPAARGRINALFVGIFFLGGAIGSAAAGLAWQLGGWPLVCAVGALTSAVALLAHLAWGGRT